MALSQFDKQVTASANKLLVNSLIVLTLWLGSAVCASSKCSAKQHRRILDDGFADLHRQHQSVAYDGEPYRIGQSECG